MPNLGKAPYGKIKTDFISGLKYIQTQQPLGSVWELYETTPEPDTTNTSTSQISTAVGDTKALGLYSQASGFDTQANGNFSNVFGTSNVVGSKLFSFDSVSDPTNNTGLLVMNGDVLKDFNGSNVSIYRQGKKDPVIFPVLTGHTGGTVSGSTSGTTSGSTTGSTTGVTATTLSLFIEKGLNVFENPGIIPPRFWIYFTGFTSGSTTGSTTGQTSGSTTGYTSGSTSGTTTITGTTSGSTTGSTTGTTSGTTSGFTGFSTVMYTEFPYFVGNLNYDFQSVLNYSADYLTGTTSGSTSGSTTGTTTGRTQSLLVRADLPFDLPNGFNSLYFNLSNLFNWSGFTGSTTGATSGNTSGSTTGSTTGSTGNWTGSTWTGNTSITGITSGSTTGTTTGTTISGFTGSTTGTTSGLTINYLVQDNDNGVFGFESVLYPDFSGTYQFPYPQGYLTDLNYSRNLTIYYSVWTDDGKGTVITPYQISKTLKGTLEGDVQGKPIISFVDFEDFYNGPDLIDITYDVKDELYFEAVNNSTQPSVGFNSGTATLEEGILSYEFGMSLPSVDYTLVQDVFYTGQTSGTTSGITSGITSGLTTYTVVEVDTSPIIYTSLNPSDPDHFNEIVNIQTEYFDFTSGNLLDPDLGNSASAFGFGNSSKGLFSFAANSYNTSEGTSSFAKGTRTNAKGIASETGGVGAVANHTGEIARSSSFFSNPGDSQVSVVTLSRQNVPGFNVPNSGYHEIYVNGFDEEIAIEEGCFYKFNIEVIAVVINEDFPSINGLTFTWDIRDNIVTNFNGVMAFAPNPDLPSNLDIVCTNSTGATGGEDPKINLIAEGGKLKIEGYFDTGYYIRYYAKVELIKISNII